jgi:hemoglobin
MMLHDIRTSEDVTRLVDVFYQRAEKDELLGPIFFNLAASSPEKQILYQYWTKILLDEGSATPEAFPRHIQKMYSRRHFVRWLNLFLETIDRLYAGSNADKAKVIIIRKSEEFQSKVALSRF